MGQAEEPAEASPAPAEASPAATGIASVLAEYGTLARRGLEADAQLKEAGLLLRRFRIRDAQILLDTAYATFTELGDQPRLAQARAALLLINRGEQLLAAACLLISAVLLAWSGHRRYAERRTALPLT